MRADLHGRPMRHQRAWLTPSWAMHLRSALSPEARATLTDWFSRGRPAAVTRHAGRGEHELTLAVTLPAARWLARMEIVVGRSAVARLAPPPHLADAFPSGPPAWIAPLADLDRAAVRAGVTLSVTGALAWQHLTGESYVTPRTPVELLFRPRLQQELSAMLEILRARDGWDGPHLAGEVILGLDDQVAWRDLAAGRRRVLVRGTAGEAITDVERLLAALR